MCLLTSGNICADPYCLSGHQTQRLFNVPKLPSGRDLCYGSTMSTEDVLAILRRYESALRARGVRHAALFGSTARGDNRPDSDIDILVEFDPDAHVGVFEYVGVKEYIESLFSQPVDVIDREGLKPHLRQSSARDAVYAF
jgi:predicted nucleotidyltransferase